MTAVAVGIAIAACALIAATWQACADNWKRKRRVRLGDRLTELSGTLLSEPDAEWDAQDLPPNRVIKPPTQNPTTNSGSSAPGFRVVKPH